MKRSDGSEVLASTLIDIAGHSIVESDICANDAADNFGVVTVQPNQTNSIVASVIRRGKNDHYRFPTPVR